MMESVERLFSNPQQAVDVLMAALMAYGLKVLGAIAMLGSFGVQTTSFVAMLGAAGLAIGLALQGTLSHVASGLMLILFRPFRVGDQIEAGAGVSGVVRSITLFVTELDTLDNIRIVVPNGLIWGSVMRNLHENPLRRMDLRFTASYGDDVDQAIQVIEAVIAAEARAPPHRPGLGGQ
jgi:small conductance mechanosensitive channel